MMSSLGFSNTEGSRFAIAQEIQSRSPSLNRVSVTSYSPYLDSFKTDDHNQFTVPYRNPGISTAPGNVVLAESVAQALQPACLWPNPIRSLFMRRRWSERFGAGGI